MNPYLFIVGCPRSGTTLLRRIADAHPDLAVMPEQHWLPRFWEARVGMTGDGLVTGELLDWLLSDRRYQQLDLPLKPLVDLIEEGPPIPYAAFVSRLFDTYGAQRGKAFVGEKTPKYVHQLVTLNELWPQHRVVHLIRDGRDVALSLLDWPKAERNVGRFPTWAEDPVSTAALYWDWCVRSGREQGQPLGPARYGELRYEALIADAAAECAALCVFLGLAYDEQMLQFHAGRARPESGLSAKRAWLPITAELRSWRRDMKPADVVRFEAAAGALLDELGYQRVAAVSRRDRAAAARLRDQFVAQLVRSGHRVPAAWGSAAA